MAAINTLIALIGPTASGKTALSIRLAKEFSCEIISADSRQFFKEMQIGTAKILSPQMQGIQHHFVDFLSILQEYNAGKFEEDVLKFLDTYFRSKSIALLVGGSGLYVQAVTGGMDKVPPADNLIRQQLRADLQKHGIGWLVEKLKWADPEYFRMVDQKNPHRIIRALEVFLISGKPYSSFRLKDKKTRDGNYVRERNCRVVKIGIQLSRVDLYENINKRVDQMIEQGLVEEARSLFKYKSLNALQTVGYVELFEFFEKKISIERAIELIKRNTRRYAKRQVTWFSKDPQIQWFHPSETEKIISFIKDAN